MDKTVNNVMSPADVEYFKKLRTKKIVKYLILTLIYIFLTVWAIIAIFPIVWSAFNSFKMSIYIVSSPMALPNANTFTLQNFVNIFGQGIDIGSAYFNSFYVSVITVVITLLVSLFAAFGLTRYRFKGKRVVNAFVVAVMMIPAFSLMLPLYRLFDKLMLIDNHFAIILMQVALNSSFSIILLSGFLSSLPVEVEESAFIDGAGVLRTLFRIVVPMMRSALITVVIFVFLWSYNDLFLQTFIIRTNDKKMIPYLLVTVTSMKGTDFGKMTAAAAMVAIPMLIVYLFLQKHIIKGLTAGAVKG